jgi:hypothetical protein
MLLLLLLPPLLLLLCCSKVCSSADSGLSARSHSAPRRRPLSSRVPPVALRWSASTPRARRCSWRSAVRIEKLVVRETPTAQDLGRQRPREDARAPRFELSSGARASSSSSALGLHLGASHASTSCDSCRRRGWRSAGRGRRSAGRGRRSAGRGRRSAGRGRRSAGRGRRSAGRGGRSAGRGWRSAGPGSCGATLPKELQARRDSGGRAALNATDATAGCSSRGVDY